MLEDVPERWQSLKSFLRLLYFDLSEVKASFASFHEPNCNSAAILPQAFCFSFLLGEDGSAVLYKTELENESYLNVKSNVSAVRTLNRTFFSP